MVRRERVIGIEKRRKEYFYRNYFVNNQNFNQNLVVLKYCFLNEWYCLMIDCSFKNFDKMGNCDDLKFKWTLNK